MGSFAQTLQNINKNNGTISNPINQIDSIRFNSATNQMEVVLQNGLETHALSDVVNVTFTSTSNACSGITSVTDSDDNEYQVISIGNQCWTKENLRSTKYADGSDIPNVTDNTAWTGLINGAWCNYDNSADSGAIYGKLYNWYTVADPRKVCPTGWHVPTEAEWTVLTDYLGGVFVAGGKMKDTIGWSATNIAATNESGFSGLPGGYRYSFLGGFYNVGTLGGWWSSTESSETRALTRILYNIDGSANSYVYDKPNGFSVRCLRD